MIVYKSCCIFIYVLHGNKNIFTVIAIIAIISSIFAMHIIQPHEDSELQWWIRTDSDGCGSPEKYYMSMISWIDLLC